MAKDNKKVEKYITEIKELPGNSSDANSDQAPQPEAENTREKTVETKKQAENRGQKISSRDADSNVGSLAKKRAEPAKEQPADSKKFSKGKTKKVVKRPAEIVGDGKSRLPMSTKDIILGIINLISLALLIILLTRLPEKAQTLKDLKNDSLIDESSVRVQSRSVEENEEEANRLERAFLDESGVVEFVREVEALRTDGGSITELSFESQKAVKDKTGSFGIPINITLQGTWEQIGQDLERIETLPYLFRPVKIVARPAEIESEGEEEDGVVVQNLIEFQYGGVLYVDEELAEN